MITILTFDAIDVPTSECGLFGVDYVFLFYRAGGTTYLRNCVRYLQYKLKLLMNQKMELD
jgi:hypothetical protein